MITLTETFVFWISQKPLFIADDKRSPPPILGQRHSFNLIGRFFFSMCSHSSAVLTNMHGMNGMWPRRPWCWVQGPSDVTVITWMHMPVMQRSLYMLWFNFILGAHFISLCFKLIITHYRAQKQREIKFKTRIKLNNIHIRFTSTCNSGTQILH